MSLTHRAGTPEAVTRAKSYLRGRPNYDVGETVLFQSELCIPVNGRLLTYYQVCLLATYESCKDEEAKPDGLAFDYMARACRKIAAHPSIHSLASDEGRDLAKRWEDWNPSAVASDTQLRVLCKRMGHFLTREFEYLL